MTTLAKSDATLDELTGAFKDKEDLEAHSEWFTKAIHDPDIAAKLIQVLEQEVPETASETTIQWDKIIARSKKDGLFVKMMQAAELAASWRPGVWATLMGGVVLLSTLAFVSSLRVGAGMQPGHPFATWVAFVACLSLAILLLAFMSLWNIHGRSDQHPRKQDSRPWSVIPAITFAGLGVATLAGLYIVFVTPLGTSWVNLSRSHPILLESLSESGEIRVPLAPNQPLTVRLPSVARDYVVTATNALARITLTINNAIPTVTDGLGEVKGNYVPLTPKAVEVTVTADRATDIRLAVPQE